MSEKDTPATGKSSDKRKTDPVTELVVLSSPAFERTAKSCPLLAGDEEAWIECCTRRFLRLAVLIAGNNDAAADALQESWIRVWQKVDSCRRDRTACAWVRTIVINCAKDAQRARLRVEDQACEDMDAFEGGSFPNPENSAQQQEMYRLLDAVVEKLPSIFRQIVELRYTQELSTEETAALLEISRSTAGTRLDRAVKRLRHRLANRIGSNPSPPPAHGENTSS